MNGISMKELSMIWLKYKERTIKKTSLIQYERIIYKYIDVYLGKYDVKELKVVYVLDFINCISLKLSKKTVQDIIVVLKSILSYGEVMNYCYFPIKAIPHIKKEKNKVDIFMKYDLLVLEEYLIKNISDRNIGLYICLYTGIRLGEICALRWEDISLLDKKISINKSVYRINEKGRSYTEIGSPKTNNSKREIPICHKLYQYLKRYYKNRGYVITGTEYYLDPRTYQYYFKKVLKNLHMNEYKFHALRHTFATNCVQCEVDIKSLSEILGHSSVKITLDIYIHSSFSMKVQQINKLSFV